MNILVLANVFAAAPLRLRLRILWIPLLALSALSIEMQIISLIRLNGLTLITVINLAALAGVLIARPTRARLGAFYAEMGLHLQSLADVFRGVRGWIDWLAIGAVVALVGYVTFYALTHIPTGGDPYHLARVYFIEHHGSLAYFPTVDYKVTSFGFLYELALVDARLIPLPGDLALRLVNPLSLIMLALLAVILYRKARGATGGDLYLWLGLTFLTVFINHFFLLKNDYLTFLLGFISLYFIYKATADTPNEVLVLSGLAAGLSFSVKTITMPLPVLAILFLPYASKGTFLRTRLAWGIGGLSGLVLGGYVFVSVNNLLVFGNLVGPLIRFIHVWSPAGVQDSLISVAHVAASILDPRRIPGPLPPFAFQTDARPLQWPTSVGGQLGWLFTFLFVIYVVLAVRFRKGLRLGALCIGYGLILALIYTYLDIDHRRLMIPAFLLCVETVGWLATLQKSVVVRAARVLVLAAMVVSFTYDIASTYDNYLSDTGLLNSFQSAASSAGVDVGTLKAANSPICYDDQVRLRAIGQLAAQAHTCVGYLRQENALWMDGITNLVPMVDFSGKIAPPQTYERCDFFVFSPAVLAQGGLPDPLKERLAGCLPSSQRLSAMAACNEPIVGIMCPQKLK